MTFINSTKSARDAIPRKYVYIFLGWTLLVAVSLAWNIQQLRHTTLNTAASAARASLAKDIGFRNWASSHGGVYVPPTAHIPPNPYLRVPNRDVVTTTGMALTLMNPAYVVREVQQDFSGDVRIKSHLTSLKLFNPKNAPDEWETKVLKSFDQGNKEALEISEIDGKPYLRLMLPLPVTEGCLKCHFNQNYKVGDNRGGIGASVLLQPYTEVELIRRSELALSHGVIWLIGLLGMGFSYRREQWAAAQSEKTSTEMRKLSKAIEQSPNSIVITDLAANIEYVNEAFVSITGYSREEVIGQNPRILHSGKTPRKTYDEMWDKLTHEEMWQGELVNKRKDGSEYTEWVKISPIHNAEGLVTNYLSVKEDITQRKLVEDALHKSEQRFHDVSDAAGEYLWEIDVNMVYTYVSNRSVDVKGYSPEELLGHTPMEFMPEEDIAPVGEIVNRAITDKVPFKLQHRDITKSGAVLWEEVNGVPFYDKNGTVIGLRGAGLNITERKQVEKELLESEHRLNVAQRIAHIGSWEWDIIANVATWSTETYRIFGIAHNNLKEHRQSFVDMVHPDDRAKVDQALTDALSGEKEYNVEYRIVLSDKTNKVIHALAEVSRNENGAPALMLGTVHDITERKRAEEDIDYLAYYDPLTHLPNRLLLIDRLKQALASSARNGQEGALLFIDLDDFKTLNETLGHDIGDQLLQQVAKRLATCIREGDTVARLGGDEFVVMLEDLSEHALEAAAQAEAIGDKILAAFNQPYLLAAQELRSTPSIGVTLFNDHEQGADMLLKQADIAMYQAKKSGRNTLRFFDPQMQDIISARAALESDLRHAVAGQEQFHLYYQVQVDSSGRPAGAEALLRWKHPVRGMVSPAEFIPLAEETGLILPLGHWVMATACQQLAAWATQLGTAHLTLAVNVSAKQFHLATFVEEVLTLIDCFKIDPAKLKLEITESMLLGNVEDIIIKMAMLKTRGINFSMDDFGTGYSSLQYLKRLPLDQLKIDQSFVRDIVTDNGDRAIVRTIISMAQGLNLSVIAEGVETEEQRQLLRDQGCTAYQGYLFGRPLPIAQFEALLKQS